MTKKLYLNHSKAFNINKKGQLFVQLRSTSKMFCEEYEFFRDCAYDTKVVICFTNVDIHGTFKRLTKTGVILNAWSVNN